MQVGTELECHSGGSLSCSYSFLTKVLQYITTGPNRLVGHFSLHHSNNSLLDSCNLDFYQASLNERRRVYVPGATLSSPSVLTNVFVVLYRLPYVFG
jgi:hypothetical protein